jgi:Flp pilus assembly protein TadD
MKISGVLITLALASPVAAQEHFGRSNAETLPVAYAELSSGKTEAAISALAAPHGVAADDPSRLINLGSALARKGRYVEADAIYRAAIASDIRYELELANGQWMDSREAAKLALSRLNRSVAMKVR